ncbi:MAG: hypothetical protein O7F16_09560 [Acidobacteria bacterium]|nr:hypothetical protein [Acidobacteriota bacterium]
MNPAKQPRFLSWPRVLAWLTLVGVLILAVDLTQRVLLYEILPRDVGSMKGLARRPVKDTALAVLHGLAQQPRAAKLPVWDFYMKPRDEELLRSELRRLQIQGGHAAHLSPQWVDARMRTGDREYDVRVRLRGQQYYHGIPPRPSLRVRMRRGQVYEGARLFNLVEPFDKFTDQTFLWESSLHGLMAWDTSMGLIALRGRPLAIVQYVEQLRRSTTDGSGRPEGMLFKGTGEIYEEGDDPGRCNPVREDVTRWLTNAHLNIPYEELRERIDIDYFRWFTALTELSGARHGFLPVNIKGYCNPISVRAEFLLWDTAFAPWSKVDRSEWAQWGKQFLRIDDYRLQHDETLYSLLEDRLDAMLARLDDFVETHADLLRQEPMNWAPRGGPAGGWMFDRPRRFEAMIRQNASEIRAALEGQTLEWSMDRERGKLLVWTTDRGSKRVTGLEFQAKGGTSIWHLPEPMMVHGRFEEHQPVVVMNLPDDMDPATLFGILAVNHHTGRSVRGTRHAAALQPTREHPAAVQEPSLPALPEGFQVRRDIREIRVGPGRVRFDGVVSLPPSWSVKVEPGTTLEGGPGALLEVRGDLQMAGTETAGIIVRGAGAEPWGAIAVVGERTEPVEVRIAHTTLIGGSGSDAGRVRYTGTLSIYFANVRLDHLTIRDGKADDALNLKYSTVDATDCRYLDGAGDAVDYDFTDGTDRRSWIQGFPDDGIDISGSGLSLQDVVLRDIGDKALSVGEASNPRITNARVFDVSVGCAVKDLSDAHVDGLIIVRADVGVAVYTKKTTFGPARATFTGLTAVDIDGMAVVDIDNEVEFVDAIRVGHPGAVMRDFPGVQNRIESGLAGMTDDEILEFVDQLRSTEAVDAESVP